MHNSVNHIIPKQIGISQASRYSIDLHQSMHLRLLDMLVLIIPMLRFIEIEAIGKLFAPDVILIALFPFLFLKKDERRKVSMQPILPMLFILWFFGQFTTDMIRHTPYVDCFRGWARIIVTLINFSVLFSLLYGNWRRIVLYAVGLAVGGILGFYLNPGIYAEGNPWKFGVGPSITCFMVLIATAISKKKSSVCISAIGFAALLNLYLGFRSLAGVCFLTMAYVWFHCRWHRKNINTGKLSFKKVVIKVLAVLTAGFLFIQGYQLLAQKGALGENALQIYEWQALGDLGLLVGGRSEILVSGRAIMDSPVIGHGSWAKDYRYTDLLVYLKHRFGYYPGESNELGLIPTHSHLFGAWVEAGILGAVFWLWILSLPLRVLSRFYKRMETLPPLVVFFAFLLIWDIFFSPFGAERRFITPYNFIVMMSFLPPRHEKRCLKKIRW